MEGKLLEERNWASKKSGKSAEAATMESAEKDLEIAAKVAELMQKIIDASAEEAFNLSKSQWSRKDDSEVLTFDTLSVQAEALGGQLMNLCLDNGEEWLVVKAPADSILEERVQEYVETLEDSDDINKISVELKKEIIYSPAETCQIVQGKGDFTSSSILGIKSSTNGLLAIRRLILNEC